MKTINFAAYLFYRYYSTGKTYGIAYFNTISALVFLTCLHVMTLLVFFNGDELLPSTDNQDRGIVLLKYLALILPVYIPFFILFKKKKLERMTYPIDKIKRGNYLLILYVVLTLVLLSVAILIRKGHLI